MRASGAYLAALAAASPAMASYVGFNYGSTFTTGAAKVQSDFEAEFKTAQELVSAPTVFNSARLYTMIVSFCDVLVLFLVFCLLCLSCLVHRLIFTPASRHYQLAHRGHPGCHQHQDQPAPRHVVLRWRRRLCQRACRPQVRHLHIRLQSDWPNCWHLCRLRGSVSHFAHWYHQRREPRRLPRHYCRLHQAGQRRPRQHSSLGCSCRSRRYLDCLGQWFQQCRDRRL